MSVWSEWSECYEGTRERQVVVTQEAVGAGKACAELEGPSSEACVDCEVDWDEWSSCEEGTRHRSQKVVVDPVGAGEQCPDLQEEREGWTCV